MWYQELRKSVSAKSPTLAKDGSMDIKNIHNMSQIWQAFIYGFWQCQNLNQHLATLNIWNHRDPIQSKFDPKKFT